MTLDLTPEERRDILTAIAARHEKRLVRYKRWFAWAYARAHQDGRTHGLLAWVSGKLLKRVHRTELSLENAYYYLGKLPS